MFRIFYRNEEGFTLIELLVVVIVLGILAGIAVPRLMGVANKAEDAKIASVAGTIRTAMDIYYVENDGSYPPTTGEDAITDWASLCTVLDTADISNDPTDYNITDFKYEVLNDTNHDIYQFLMSFESASTEKVYYLGELNFSQNMKDSTVDNPATANSSFVGITEQ